MSHRLTVAEFLSASGPILDVRSPGEFGHAHIPGAISLPLFTDAERAEVGTCYKQRGRDEAVELGFAIAGPKTVEFVRQAKVLAPDRQVRVHCWRGGMRSEAIAWILEMAGLQVSLLQGGYKAFRHWALALFEIPKSIVMLGGMTGCGKTAILQELALQGAQILDLEQLANHRGSSYGHLDLPPQPTTEQFENTIALQWVNFQSDRPIWIEAESRQVGTCRIPDGVFEQMERAPMLEICRSRSERLALLVELYGTVDRQELIVATERIRKRLGGLRTQQAVDWLQQGDLMAACEIILTYYDKTYTYDLQRRSVLMGTIDVTGLSAAAAAQVLLEKGILFGNGLSNESPNESK